MASPILTLGIPAGDLQEATAHLLARAGYTVTFSPRSYYPDIDDPEIECLLVRVQEMGRYVELGVLDAGVTGHDWIVESGSHVHEVCELMLAPASHNPVRWVLCVPQESNVTSVKDLQGKRIATEVVALTKTFLAKHDVTAQVDFSWGATELKPPRLADAIVEVMETDSTLRTNNLRVVAEVLQSTPRLIANQTAYTDNWKRNKIDSIALMLKACLSAERKVGLMMNVQRTMLHSVLKHLPALQKPTVSSLADPDWVDVNAIIDDSLVRSVVPRLKAAGARGIIEYSITKIIH